MDLRNSHNNIYRNEISKRAFLDTVLNHCIEHPSWTQNCLKLHISTTASYLASLDRSSSEQRTDSQEIWRKCILQTIIKFGDGTNIIPALLLDQKFWPQGPDAEVPRTAFIVALKERRTDICRRIVRAGQSDRFRSQFFDSPFVFVADSGDVDMLSYLVKTGTRWFFGCIPVAPACIKDDLSLSGDRALRAAANRGHAEIIKMLVEPKNTYNVEQQLNEHAIRYLLRTGTFFFCALVAWILDRVLANGGDAQHLYCPDVIKHDLSRILVKILDVSAANNARLSSTVFQPYLVLAAREANPRSIQVILEHKKFKKAKLSHPRRLFWSTAAGGSIKILDLLQQRDMQYQQSKAVPIAFAAMNGHVEMAEHLRTSHTPTVPLADLSPLHGPMLLGAIRNRKADGILWLFKTLNVDPNADLTRRQQMVRPLMFAAQCGFPDIVRTLLDHGATPVERAAFPPQLQRLETSLRANVDMDLVSELARIASIPTISRFYISDPGPLGNEKDVEVAMRLAMGEVVEV